VKVKVVETDLPIEIYRFREAASHVALPRKKGKARTGEGNLEVLKR